jgi:PAS domain S-box-containing protein
VKVLKRHLTKAKREGRIRMRLKTNKPPPLPFESFYAVVEAWPVGVTITDGRVEPPGPNIVYVNPAFCELTGYEAAEVMGRNPRFLQGPDTSRTVLDRLRKALVEQTTFFGETVNYRKDGTPFVMQWQISPILNESGRVDCFVALQRDVTEVRRMEALAEAVNLADNIGYTMTSMRHELGNPVNSMKAAITLLRSTFGSQSQETIERTLGHVLDEIRRIEYLLRGMRSFNAFETPAVETVALSPFLARFVETVATDAAARGCAIRMEEDSPSLTVNIDPRALYQILINLVTNALEAMEGQSSHHHSLTNIDLRNPRDNRNDWLIRIRVSRGFKGTVEIAVIDNGPGIDASKLHRVFHPFFTTKRNGTGIGLAIVKKLLAQMDAGIEVVSSVNVGSTFTLTLPAGKEALIR